MSSGSGEPPQAQPGTQSNFSFLCILALRLLKGSSADSKEVTENCKENSKEKELCLDNKKEVGGFVCVDVMVRIKKRMDGNVSPLFLSSFRRSSIIWRKSSTMRCRPKTSWSISSGKVTILPHTHTHCCKHNFSQKHTGKKYTQTLRYKILLRCEDIHSGLTQIICLSI